MKEVLHAAHYGGGVSIQSNLARTHAFEVAAAASTGYLTTWQGDAFGGRWYITRPGLAYLETLS